MDTKVVHYRVLDCVLSTLAPVTVAGKEAPSSWSFTSRQPMSSGATSSAGPGQRKIGGGLGEVVGLGGYGISYTGFMKIAEPIIMPSFRITKAPLPAPSKSHIN